jgi:hypothetical protein
MEKGHTIASEQRQRRNVHSNRDFVLAGASHNAQSPAAITEYPSGPSPCPWAARYPADADVDAEILAWIASHVRTHNRLKPPH